MQQKAADTFKTRPVDPERSSADVKGLVDTEGP